MSNQYLLKESRTVIELEARPFAGGGEGNLYKIKSPAIYQNYVAKLYHPHKISQQRENKTQYLIDHPPIGLSENGSIVWIKDALYTKSYKFAGFIMLFAKGEKLEVLCLGKLPKKIHKNWQRFDLKKINALQYRLRICFNLAAAIYQMHATDRYVLVDMKPENIILQLNGLLAIVDTDSVEVIENELAIFPAPVATPEYTPPEFYTGEHQKNGLISESWDRFGLAVIFYKLLCGIHPFAGTAKPPYDNLVSLHEKIKHGLFVHSKSNKTVFSVVPPPHEQFKKLDPNLQELFIQCFEEGHKNPEARPTANEWCSAFLVAIGDATLEKHFAHIMGLWENTSRIKIEMPSSLYQKKIQTIHPKIWLSQKIETNFDSLPPLPISLHQAIESGTQHIKLALGFKDYLFSWVLFFCLLLPILFFIYSGKREGINFWLLDTWQINFIAIVIMASPLFIFPRLISWIRHIISPEMKVRKLWNTFRLTYPQLKQDVIETKRVLLEKILAHNKKEINAFETERAQYEDPLKEYLRQQDLEVKALMDQRKIALDAVRKKNLDKTSKNQLLVDMKDRSVLALYKRINSYYQKKLKSVELELALENERETLSQIDFLQEKQVLKENFEAAQILLQELIAKEQKEVDLIEDNYVTGYQAIYKDSEVEVLRVTKIIEELNESYKTEVNKLLATPNVEKIQLSMKEKVQQAKEEIIQLEKLKF